MKCGVRSTWPNPTHVHSFIHSFTHPSNTGHCHMPDTGASNKARPDVFLP